ncbi:hypothetical protein PC116_g30647, partial [Phytophthora cactorum]
MKNGLRVVRIPKAPERRAELARQSKAKRDAARLAKQEEQKGKRADVQVKPEPNIKNSPLGRIPFKNPDLDDKPLHWSPRMFKPEIDRHNWTWSDWDSPSREIEDVTYQTTDWPIHNPLAALPPHIREKLEALMQAERDILGQQPDSNVTADTVRYEEVDTALSFLSEASTRSNRPRLNPSHPDQSTSSSSEFSSWVNVDSRPWPPHVLRMFIEGEEERKEWEEKKRNLPPMSPIAESISDVYIPMDSSEPSCKLPSEPTNSSGLSSLLQLYVDSDNYRQRWEAEKEEKREQREKKEREEQEEKELLEMVARAKAQYAHEDSSAHSDLGSFASYNSDVANQYARNIHQILQDLRGSPTAAPASASAQTPSPRASSPRTPSPAAAPTSVSPIHYSSQDNSAADPDSFGSYNTDVAMQ